MNECIVLFDGVCNLCNGTVQCIIKNDSKQRFRFAALQSDKAKTLLEANGIQNSVIDSVVLVVDGRAWVKSDAVLQISRRLGGLWPICYVGVVIPRRLRDSLYDFVAKNQYQWFGKEQSCWLPTPELRQRFLS